MFVWTISWNVGYLRTVRTTPWAAGGGRREGRVGEPPGARAEDTRGFDTRHPAAVRNQGSEAQRTPSSSRPLLCPAPRYGWKAQTLFTTPCESRRRVPAGARIRTAAEKRLKGAGNSNRGWLLKPSARRHSAHRVALVADVRRPVGVDPEPEGLPLENLVLVERVPPAHEAERLLQLDAVHGTSPGERRKGRVSLGWDGCTSERAGVDGRREFHSGRLAPVHVDDWHLVLRRLQHRRVGDLRPLAEGRLHNLEGVLAIHEVEEALDVP